jgi:glycosyltransferase involved in cell wall biosynthesis
MASVRIFEACHIVNPTRRFFIQASNVHQGGGATLLRALLANPVDACVHLQVDDRMRLESISLTGVAVRTVRASLWNRLLAERWLARSATKNDLVLCLGNLPPLFRNSARLVIYLQNRYLLDAENLGAFPLRVRLRLLVERWWLRLCADSVDVFVVQTPSMASALQASGMAGNKQVVMLPFVANADGYKRSGCDAILNEEAITPPTASHKPFLYVASGEPHKNHKRLIEAWQLLATQGLFPTLWITLENAAFPDLCKWVESQAQNANLKLHNWGKLPHDEVAELYTKAGAMIYPSMFESFGLPLIEARQSGLPVIASELDFVRDVLDPEEVFDPESSHSIARAVKRFLGIHEPPLPLMTAADFIDRILKDWK